jgi:hypothetical protein
MVCALVPLLTSCSGSSLPGSHQEPESALRPNSGSAYCLTAQCIYVTNAYRPAAVDIYRTDEHGAARPIGHIEGPATELAGPSAVAVDADHNLYVAGADYSSQYASAVNVYPAGQYGDVAPMQTITGPNTQMGIATGVAVDSARNIYVTNWFGGTPCVGSITVYAANANGDAPPIAQIKGAKTRLCDPGGIAIDPNGNLYVTSGQQYSSAVNIYAAGSSGNVRPMAEILGKRTLLYDPTGITLDALNNVYVSSDAEGTLTKYRAGSHGNVKPVQAIYGIRTKLQDAYGVAVDLNARIYANNTVRGNIVVFASDANGDVPPIRVIRRNNRSNLRRPTNIAIR